MNHEPGRLDETSVLLSLPRLSEDIELTRAHYAASIANNHLLVVRDGELQATPINLTTGELQGDPVTIVDNVASDLTTWLAAFDAGPNGALVFHEASSDVYEDQFVSGGSTFGESRRTTIHQRDGRPVNILADGVPQNTTAIAPDGMQMAISAAPVDTASAAGFDIWVYPTPNLTGSNENAPDSPQVSLERPPRRLTFMQGAEVYPTWSPDGEWIAFGLVFDTGTSNLPGLYRVRARGGQPELLVESATSDFDALFPLDWTLDGRHIVMQRGSWIANGTNNIAVFDFETGEVTTLVEDAGDDRQARVSPNGKWLAYESNASGTVEVFVVPFWPGWADDQSQGLPTPREDARARISIAGGGRPRWNSNGLEMYYISRSDTLISVNVDTSGAEFIHDVGSALFEASFESGVDLDVSGEGTFFAINSSIEERPTDISILVNWQELLRD